MLCKKIKQGKGQRGCCGGGDIMSNEVTRVNLIEMPKLKGDELWFNRSNLEDHRSI